jgi:DNA-binding IclR family transcriptional regulator
VQPEGDEADIGRAGTAADADAAAGASEASEIGRPAEWWAAAAPSNPTVRVIAIVEHLSRHPDRSFRATELARALDMTKSTCLAILGTLTDAGYLTQHPTRRDYRLGPALVTAGRAAQARFPDLSRGHELMRRCAAQLLAPVNATAIVDDQIVIVEVVGDTDPFGGVLRPGVRVPFRPPYGAVFVAWGDTPLLRTWLTAAQPPVDDRQLATLRRSLDTVRQRGFVVTVPLPPDHELVGVQDQLFASARRVDAGDFDRLAAARMTGSTYLLDDVAAGGRYAVGQVQAPVLPAPGREPLAVSVNLWGRTLTGAEILSAGDALVTTANQLATALL